MAKQRNSLRAGLFILVSIGLALFVMVAISGSSRLTHRFEGHTVRFLLTDDIGGLRPGDDVRIGGLKVGSVNDISIEKREGDAKPAMYVGFSIPAQYRLCRTAHVGVQTQLTGASVLNIDDFGEGPALAPGETISGTPAAFAQLSQQLASLDLKTISAKLNKDLDKIGGTFDNATALTASVHAKVPEMVDHYHAAIAAAVGALDAVREFLGPASGDFHGTMSNVNGITANLKEKTPELLTSAQGVLKKLDATVGRASATMVDVQSTLSNARDISAEVRSILVGKRSKIEAIVASLKTTGDNLKYASSEIRHSPWRLLYKPSPGEVQNLNIYDSVRQFAEGANSLDDAASALRDATRDKNAKPEDIRRLMGQLDDSFTNFKKVEQKLWTDVKE